MKEFLRTNILTKGIYNFLGDHYYRSKEKKEQNRKKKQLQKEGVKVIRCVQEIMEKTGFKFFFDMGTLLGIVREGRLLKHDMDIDVGVYVGTEEEKLKIREMLLETGAKEQYRFSIDEVGIIEQSFVYKNIKFDINYYLAGESDVCYLMYNDPDKQLEAGQMSVVKLHCPHIEKINKILFQGIEINAPEDPEGYLAVRYGENWRIPDKKYIYWKGPSTQPTNYIGHRIIFEQTEE